MRSGRVEAPAWMNASSGASVNFARRLYPRIRDLHSSTYQLNVSAFGWTRVIWGCLGSVSGGGGGGVQAFRGCAEIQERLKLS